MSRHSPRQYIHLYEIGGHELEWHVTYTPGAPETRTQPADDPELEVTRVDLPVVVSMPKGIVMRKIDITDLILELSGGEYPDDALYELLSLSLDALEEEASDDL